MSGLSFLSAKPLSKSTPRFRDLFLGSTFLLFAGPVLAADIDTSASWDNTTYITPWGVPPATATYGQTITPDATQTVLSSFSFNVYSLSSFTPQYKAYVYEWDADNGTTTGSALFSSAVLIAPSSSDSTIVTFETGGISLEEGKTYVLFLSTSEISGQSSGHYRWAAVDGTEYEGGSAVFDSNDTDFTSLGTSTWEETSSSYDMWFQALFGPALSFDGAEIAANFYAPATRMMNNFLSVSLDPFSSNRMDYGARFASATFGTSKLGYTNDTTLLNQEQRTALDVVGGKLPADSLKRYNFWTSAYGAYNNTDSTSSNNGSISRGYGIAIGMDYWLSQDSMIGMAVGYGKSSWEQNKSASNGAADIYQTGIFGRHSFDQYYIAGSASVAYHHVETDRISALGTPHGDFDAWNIGARVEGGFELNWAQTKLTPYAALQIQNLYTPNYSESGPSDALSFESENTVTPRTEFGVKLEKEFQPGKQNEVRLFGRMAWAHDYNDKAKLTGSYISSPATNVLISSDKSPSDLALVSAGAEFAFGKGWSARAQFDGEFGVGTQTYAGSGTLSYRW